MTDRQNNFKSMLARLDSSVPDLVRQPSLLVIIFTLCFSFWFVDFWRPYNQQAGGHNFYWDVFGYYSYLPAYFCNGGSMELPTPLADYNPPGPIGKHVPKYTYGLAAMQAPFFALAYKIAVNQDSPRDGFSEPFVTCIHWGSIFYVILGMFFLRRLLLYYFSETVVAIVLAASLFGSMLFFYTFVQSEMTHGYLFCLFCIYLYLVRQWHERQRYVTTFWMGLVLGLAVLIRPTEVFIFLYFLVWNVKSWKGLGEKFGFLLRRWPHLLMIVLICAAWWIPQLLFYKEHAGRYFYFSYMRERFFWNDPQILNVLLSYRKGWITYTPVVLLAFAGFFFVGKKVPVSGLSFALITFSILYVLSCWWDWNYGGCFGARSFCQQIAILALPMCAVVERVLMPGRIRKLSALWSLLLLLFLSSCVCLNIGQTYHYQITKKIHPWGTSKTIYWDVIRTYQFDNQYQDKWWRDLKEPDFLKYSDGSDRDQ